MIGRSSTIKEARENALYSEGDILRAENGGRFVITDIMLSTRLHTIYYRGAWKGGGGDSLVNERATEKWDCEGEMERPWNWK